MNHELIKLLGSTDIENSILLPELEQSLAELEQELLAVCESGNRNLTENLKRLILSGGKRLRPVLVYLGYAAGREDEKRNSYDYPVVPLMAAVELVHTSSLIHDDIVDMATVRRSVPTINATSGNSAAVQAGDYLLAKAAHTLMHYKGMALEKHFAYVAGEMCQAEFKQIEREYVFNDDSKEHYFQQIRRKTAAFISACTALGAQIGGASDTIRKALEEYGLNAGIAFQIRDDVLDFVPGEHFGKKCGQDVERGIFTLPLILALQMKKDTKEGADARAIAVSRNKNEEEIRSLLDFVIQSDAIGQAQREIELYTQKAAAALEPLKEGEIKKTLTHLADALAVRCI